MHLPSRIFSKIGGQTEFLINKSDIERRTKFFWSFMYPNDEQMSNPDKGVFLYHVFDGDEHPEVIKFVIMKTVRSPTGTIEKWLLQITPEMKTIVPTPFRRAKMVIANV